MRRFFLGVLTLFVFQSAHAQEFDPEEFNKYKYMSVETLIDKKRDRVDPWGISTYVRFKLIKLGFTVIDDNKANWNEDAKFNECLVITCDITDKTGKLGRNRLELHFLNCHGDTVFYNRGSGYEETEEKAYQVSVDRTLEPMEGIEYSFRPDLALDPVLPDVETTEDDEDKLKSYLDSGERKPIEGIYSFSGEKNYRIGIKKDGDGFQGAILSSDAEYWKVYEIKIHIEPSSLGDDVFNITWLDDTKSKSEAVGKLVNGDLVMEIKKDNRRETIKLIKEYPVK